MPPVTHNHDAETRTSRSPHPNSGSDRHRKTWYSANQTLAILTIFLLAGAFLRLSGLNNQSPPGLEHDEVAHWLINRAIAEGQHAIYFQEAFGHEAGYHYLQTGFMLLLGDNALALRLPSAFLGLLLVAISFNLIRRLFGTDVALMATAVGAVLLWPVFYSRLGLRAISLPAMSGLSAIFWWRGWETVNLKGNGRLYLTGRGRLAVVNFLLAGLLAGMSLHTYMASRALPIFYILYILYLGLFHRQSLRYRRPAILTFLFTFTIIAAPLVIYLLTHPGSESRINEVNQPLLALMQLDLRPVLENTLKIAGMFAIKGDPLWRQNVAFLPVFDPIIGVLFGIGLLKSLWQWRVPKHAFIILWLFTSSIPSMVTIDAPSYIRIINALPLLVVFPAIGIEVIHRFARLSTVIPGLSPEIKRLGPPALLAIIVIGHSVRTAVGLFSVWTADPEVRFVWQADLTNAATFLDESDNDGPVAIGGWTPESMDPPTMALSLKREDLSLRYFDPGNSLIVPVTRPGEIDRIVRPAILPLEPALEGWLMARAATEINRDGFVLYEMSKGALVDPQNPIHIDFGEEVTLLGLDREPDCPASGGSCQLIAYWRVLRQISGPRRFFIHLVDRNGALLAQDDRLGAPAEHWRAGDLILQSHWLPVMAEGSDLELRLGYYNPDTGIRLLTPEQAEFVTFNWNR